MHQVSLLNPLADHCELNVLLELGHPLQSIIRHHTASVTTAALSCVEKYKEYVESIRYELVSNMEPPRLPFIQLLAKYSSTPDEETERDHMWTTVLRHIDLDMKPSLLSLWRLKGTLPRIIEVGKVYSHSVFLTAVGGYNPPREDPIESETAGTNVERDH